MRLTYITRVKARQPVLFIINKITRPYQYYVVMVGKVRFIHISRSDFFICVQYYSLDMIIESEYGSVYYDTKDRFAVSKLIKTIKNYECSSRNKRHHRIRKQNPSKKGTR